MPLMSTLIPLSTQKVIRSMARTPAQWRQLREKRQQEDIAWRSRSQQPKVSTTLYPPARVK